MTPTILRAECGYARTIVVDVVMSTTIYMEAPHVLMTDKELIALATEQGHKHANYLTDIDVGGMVGSFSLVEVKTIYVEG